MSLKSSLRFSGTLSFRLTLWYFIIFSLSVFAGFFLFNYLLSSSLHHELDQGLIAEAKEISLVMERKGIHGVRTAMMLEAESEGVEKMFCRLMDMEGEVIIATDDTHWNTGPGRKAINTVSGGKEFFFETISIPQRKYSARALYVKIGDRYILQIMASLEDINKFLTVFRQVFFITMGFLLIIATIAGWFMARRALGGVEEVTETAIQVSDGRFDQRVKITGHGEEIDRLAATFNSMLEKVQTLIRDVKEISDNIAHDLRSPVTRIRGIAETTLISANEAPEFESMAGSIIEECDSLLTMINTMLYISETEAGVSRLNISNVNLSEVITEACDLFQPVAEDKNIKIITQIPPDTNIKADEGKIQRLIANLLDNALKYTPENGTVTFSIKEDLNEVAVSIKDTGMGISEQDLPKIFNRFYRCDRSRSIQGAGLGLSLAKAIVQAHNGSIAVSSEPDRGSTFTFTLPKTG